MTVGRRGLLLAALAIAGCGFAGPAGAEVRISGAADALRLEARNATLDEVLRALRATYKFRYHGSVATGAAVSGAYSGSLPRVVTRLLTGYNYVLRSSADGLDVSIITANGGAVQQVHDPQKDCTYNYNGRIVPVDC